MEEETHAAFARAGIETTPEDRAFFDRLHAVVLEGNRRMNLTRITDRDEFLSKHVLDSLLPFYVVSRLRGLDAELVAADLGSGAGFPGLVLARFHPGWTIRLIERTLKKARFLEEAARELGLANVSVLAKDAREAGEIRRACDLVTARAVGRIAEVSRAAAPLLRSGGLLVHYKGGELDAAELEEGRRAAPGAGLQLDDPVPYDLPPDARRSVVIAVSRPSGRKRRGGHRPKRAR